MSIYTPLLQATFQIVSTYLLFVIIMTIAKIKLNRLSLIAAFGLSIFLGYFLFWFIEVLISGFVVIIIFKMLCKRRKPSQRHVPPDQQENRRPQGE